MSKIDVDAICRKINPEEIWNATKPREYKRAISPLILRANHFIFQWYYNRVDEHFHQWTFIKSVKLLIQHWNHDQLLKKNATELNRTALKEIDGLRSELSNIRMQQIANPGQLETLNKIFGTNFNDSKDN